MNEPTNDAPKGTAETDVLAKSREILAQVRERINVLMRRDALSRARATRFVRIGMIILGGLAAAAAQFLPPLITKAAPAEWWIATLGIAGALLVFVGGLWAGFAEDVAPEALIEAHIAIDKADNERAVLRVESGKFEAERAELENLQEMLSVEADFAQRLVALYGALRETIERILRNGRPVTDGDIVDILELVGPSIHALIGFDAGEYATVSVYRVGKPGEMRDDTLVEGHLISIATRRPARRDEGRRHRTWAPGVGVGGHALMTGRETVVSDMSDNLTAGWVHFPDGVDRMDWRYTSIAAVPIRVAKDTPVWGMVIATSDQAGRFEVDEESFASGEIEPLIALSGMIALLVARDTPPPAKEPSATNPIANGT